MPDKPIGKLSDGTEVYRVVDQPPHDSLAVMAFTGQADGAIPNGSRVRKVNTEPRDSFEDGTEGTVLASARVPDVPGLFGYYVAFDPSPLPCFISGARIEAIT